jgi:modification methylase
LVEAAALGRRCIGVELEERWVAVTRANLRHALPATQRRLARVCRGDARRLDTLLKQLAGQVDLIVVSPPYSCEAGVIDKQAWLGGTRLCDAATLNYSTDTGNIGHARGEPYRLAMSAIYRQCFGALRPNGLLVTVTKNMRADGRLIDLVSTTIELTRAVGLGYLQHNIALHAGVREGRLVPRPSFWQLNQTQRAQQSGLPLHLIAHEDALVFVKPRGDDNG